MKSLKLLVSKTQVDPNSLPALPAATGGGDGGGQDKNCLQQNTVQKSASELTSQI